jgi:beta-aspartyl-peptidase (threonine type)
MLTVVAAAAACTAQAPGPPPEPMPRWGMVIHTGAGNFTFESLGDRQSPMRAAMTDALAAGHRILASGGSSLDAVQAAIVVLEDSPEFNAGKGAVFTHEGTNELDAAIMDGRTMMAGAVAGVKHVKNPIRLARLVMEKSPHVMMVGDGAEAFGRQQGGIEFVPESYFRTELRWRQLQRAIEEENAKAKQGASIGPVRGRDGTYFGTVGAVALDRRENLAAATSTGGLTNKRFGSPWRKTSARASNIAASVRRRPPGHHVHQRQIA